MIKFEDINIKEIEPKLFEDVIIFTLAEPGAMGEARLMKFVKKNKKCFQLFYNETISYEDIKCLFPVLKDCYWKGPIPHEYEYEKISDSIYQFNDINSIYNDCYTKVSKGWRHIYTGFGNHLVIKEEYFNIFEKYIQDIQPVEMYFKWQDRLEEFLAEINQE